jgi:hypothetical protein
METKLKRGQKRCDGCGTTCGARTLVCKECGNKFVVVRGRSTNAKKYRIDDWTTLNAGDLIRCKQGSGPYFISFNGEKTYTTEQGTYRVVKLLDNGIQAWGPHGYTFLYMGKERQSKHLESYYQSPHRVRYARDHFSKHRQS